VFLTRYLHLVEPPPERDGREGVLQPPLAIFVFGEVHGVITGKKEVVVSIKNARQRKLLAFLATVARELKVDWEFIVNKIYDTKDGKDPAALRKLLDDDIKAIRDAFKAAFVKAGLPYVNPIFVDGKGDNVPKRLADPYQVVDLNSLEEIAQQVVRVKREGPGGIRAVRGVYSEVLQSVAQGFIGRQVRDINADLIDSWETEYVERYHQKYVRLLQDCTECEGALGERLSGEEQRVCYWQAAHLYKQLAFEQRPVELVRVNSQSLATLSEHALRQSMKFFGRLNDVLAIEQTFSEYRNKMRQISSDWQANNQTLELIHEIVKDVSVEKAS